ncbi:MAG: DMT family transporter [Silicimonas sp.]|jgi:drug/metabolite transporter (DMT)-like permease|nr:DMT family transporter [Silicimonas sp.]
MIGVLGLVWGTSFLFVELALTGITPFWLAASRILLAGAATTLVWRLRGYRLFTTGARASISLIVTVGALSTALPFMALSWGQQFVTAGFAGVSMAAVGLMVLPLAHVLTDERMTLRKSIGFVIGFVGVVVLIGPDAFRSSGIAGELPGRVACLSAAACYAVSSVLLRRIPPVDPVGLSAVTLWIGGIMVAGAALWYEGLPSVPSQWVISVIVTLGLIQTALANLMRIWVARTAGATFLSLTNYQVPLWSVLLGTIFLGEALETRLFLAMGLILAGVALSQWGAFRRLFRGGTKPA